MLRNFRYGNICVSRAKRGEDLGVPRTGVLVGNIVSYLIRSVYTEDTVGKRAATTRLSLRFNKNDICTMLKCFNSGAYTR